MIVIDIDIISVSRYNTPHFWIHWFYQKQSTSLSEIGNRHLLTCIMLNPYTIKEFTLLMIGVFFCNKAIVVATRHI